MEGDLVENVGEIGFLNVGGVVIVEIIQDADGVAAPQSMLDEIGANKAGAAGHENSHKATDYAEGFPCGKARSGWEVCPLKKASVRTRINLFTEMAAGRLTRFSPGAIPPEASTG